MPVGSITQVLTTMIEKIDDYDIHYDNDNTASFSLVVINARIGESLGDRLPWVGRV
jgi:hypothetical protein